MEAEDRKRYERESGLEDKKVTAEQRDQRNEVVAARAGEDAIQQRERAKVRPAKQHNRTRMPVRSSRRQKKQRELFSPGEGNDSEPRGHNNQVNEGTCPEEEAGICDIWLRELKEKRGWQYNKSVGRGSLEPYAFYPGSLLSAGVTMGNVRRLGEENVHFAVGYRNLYIMIRREGLDYGPCPTPAMLATVRRPQPTATPQLRQGTPPRQITPQTSFSSSSSSALARAREEGGAGAPPVSPETLGAESPPVGPATPRSATAITPPAHDEEDGGRRRRKMRAAAMLRECELELEVSAVAPGEGDGDEDGNGEDNTLPARTKRVERVLGIAGTGGKRLSLKARIERCYKELIGEEHEEKDQERLIKLEED